MVKVVEIFHETDCDKLATAITAALDASKADTAAIEAYEKAHPEDKKAFEAANEATMKKVLPRPRPTRRS